MMKKYFWKLLILSLFFTGHFLWFSPAKASSCSCTGPIYSVIKVGNTAQIDRNQTYGALDNTCVAETLDDMFSSTDDCEVYLQKNITNYLTTPKPPGIDAYKFDGKCALSTCGDLTFASSTYDIRKPILNILIPDLTFSDVNKTVDQNGNVQIPWIGEYIAAIYRLLVNVASILGVILIIREGVRIILSAGGEDKVAGYHNIGRILIGLILAWFSYIILYNLNSSLVAIRPLNIRVVANNIAPTEDEGDPENTADNLKKTIDKAKAKTPGAVNTAYNSCTEWTSGRKSNFSCDRWNAGLIKECGVTPRDSNLLAKPFESCPNPANPQEDIPLYTTWGSRASVLVLKDMKDAICKAVVIAKKNGGYELRINSSYRSFKEQATNWCNEKNHTGGRAAPGYSNHGEGAAIDVFLFKDGKRLTQYGFSDGKQCDTKPEDAKKLGEIFYAADPLFHRLRKELWHFEYDQEVDDAHGKFFKFPYECKSQEHD